MERYAINGERAFQTLTRVSQNTNRKLHDIADELVRTRTLASRQGLPPPDPRT
jgi:AmiR/NasT family two-component response regulator